MATLAACVRTTSTGEPTPAGGLVSPTSDAVRAAEAARRKAGQQTVTASLTPRKVTVDLGGPTVTTWAYGDTIPGPVIRGARAGDLLRVAVDQRLPRARPACTGTASLSATTWTACPA